MSVKQLTKIANKLEVKLNKVAAESVAENLHKITSIAANARATSKLVVSMSEAAKPEIDHLIALNNELNKYCQELYQKATNKALTLLNAGMLKDVISTCLTNFKSQLPAARENPKYDQLVRITDLLGRRINDYTPMAIVAAKVSDQFEKFVMVAFDEMYDILPDQVQFKEIMSSIFAQSKLNTPEGKLLRTCMYPPAIPENLRSQLESVVKNLLIDRSRYELTPNVGSVSKPVEKKNSVKHLLTKESAVSVAESFKSILNLHNQSVKLSNLVNSISDGTPAINKLIYLAGDISDLCGGLYSKAKTKSLTELNANMLKETIPTAINNFINYLPAAKDKADYEEIKDQAEALLVAANGYQPMAILVTPISEEFKHFVATAFYGLKLQVPSEMELTSIMKELVAQAKLNTPEAKILRQCMYSKSIPENLTEQLNGIVKNLIKQSKLTADVPSTAIAK